jgi:hypothetical protein
VILIQFSQMADGANGNAGNPLPDDAQERIMSRARKNLPIFDPFGKPSATSTNDWDLFRRIWNNDECNLLSPDRAKRLLYAKLSQQLMRTITVDQFNTLNDMFSFLEKLSVKRTMSATDLVNYQQRPKETLQEYYARFQFDVGTVSDTFEPATLVTIWVNGLHPDFGRIQDSIRQAPKLPRDVPKAFALAQDLEKRGLKPSHHKSSASVYAMETSSSPSILAVSSPHSMTAPHDNVVPNPFGATYADMVSRLAKGEALSEKNSAVMADLMRGMEESFRAQESLRRSLEASQAQTNSMYGKLNTVVNELKAMKRDLCNSVAVCGCNCGHGGNGGNSGNDNSGHGYNGGTGSYQGGNGGGYHGGGSGGRGRGRGWNAGSGRGGHRGGYGFGRGGGGRGGHVQNTHIEFDDSNNNAAHHQPRKRDTPDSGTHPTGRFNEGGFSHPESGNGNWTGSQ